MGHEVASAYVRIRPNMAGFRSETEGGVKAALLGAAKVVGGVVAVEGLARLTEDVVRSAATQQAELAAVEQSVKNVGAAWRVQGKTVTEVLEEEARRSGFAVTDLGQGFVRLESGVKDTVQAVHLLHDAEDVARARHLGLAQASVILARAAQGSDTALRRLGIIIPKLSENQAALRREHDAATAAGVRFTAGQQGSYKAAVANAAALDKQASSANVIAEIERRFGGQSARFAHTSAGEFARLGENVHQLKVGIGEDALPALNALAEGVGREVTALRESDGVHHAVIGGVAGLRAIFLDARGAVEAVAPPLEAVAHAAADVIRVAGANGLLAFALGFKTISIATTVAGATQARYAAIVAAGSGAEAKAAATTTAHTAAKAADTVAVTANTAALAANAETLAATSGLGLTQSLTRIAGGYNVATVGASGLVVATREGEAAAAGMTSRLSVLGRGVFALSGGWVTLASVGLGAAAFGLYKVVTADTATEVANKHLLTSLDELGHGLAREATLARDFADSVSSIKTDRVAVESARASLALARQAAASSTAARGSAEYLSIQAQLAQALDGLRVAQRSLSQEEERAAGLRRSRVAEQEKNLERQARAAQRAAELAKASASEGLQSVVARSGVRAVPVESAALRARAAQVAAAGAASFASALERDAARQRNANLRSELQQLAAFATALGRIPSQRQISLVLTARSPKLAEAALLAQLDRMDREAAAGGARGGRSFADRFRAALGEGGGLFSPILAGIAAVARQSSGAAAAAVKDSSKVARDAAKITEAATRSTLRGLETKVGEARQAAEDAARTVVRSTASVADAERGVRIAGRDIADAERGVADAIAAGARTVADAVAQAKQNLFSIGSSLADTIAQFLDAKDKTQQALTGPQARELARLRAEILHGQGGPETERAAQELAAKIEAAQKGGGSEARKEKVKRDIADLVDELNKGAITVATFNRRLAAVLSREGITYKRAGQVLGVAFADGFRAEVEGLARQARASAAGPRRPGTGQEPTIVRPLEALRESQRQIAQAQRARDDALYAKTAAIRNLADAQYQEERSIDENARAQRRLASLQTQHAKVAAEEARASRHLTSLVEQHTRYLADQARKEAGREARSEASARGAGPVRGGGGADLGHDLGRGIAGGVDAEVRGVVRAIEDLVAAALLAGRRKARAASPSRETHELGRDLGLGLAQGLASSHADAGRAAEALVGHALDRAAAARASGGLAEDLTGHVRRLNQFGKDADSGRAERDRELVEAVRALARLEGRLGRDLLAEERRQTDALGRIHTTQTRPPSAPRATRPSSAASDRARMAATQNLEV